MMRAGLITLLLITAGCTAEKEKFVDPRGASLLGQAQAAHGRGALVEALALIDSAEQYVPELPMLHFMRGLVLGDFYRFDESREAFQRTLELDPAYRGAHFNLGNNAFLQSSFLLQDSFRAALRHYESERDLLNGFIRRNAAREGDRVALSAVLLQIGQTYSRLDVADSARAAYEEALRLDSTNAKAYAWLADLQRSRGDLDGAYENARRAAKLETGNTEYLTLLGTLLVEKRDFEAAVAPLQAVAEKEPWNRTAVHNLGRALVGMGREEDGLPYLTRADTLETLRSQVQLAQMRVLQKPDDPVRWENYALLLQQSGRGAEARKAVNALRYTQANTP